MSAAADTLGVGVGMRVLELLEPRVDLESLGEALHARHVLAIGEVVAGQAARCGGRKVSAAADTCQIGQVSGAAHLSDFSVALTLSASAKAAGPSGVATQVPLS